MLLPFLPSAKSLTNNPKLFCRNTESIEDSPGASGFTESQTEKVNSPEDTHESPSSASCTRDCKSSERRALTEQLPLFLHVAPLLENTGSVARDHLANERTWLAYIRTSLAISGTGIALVQLFTVTALSDSTIVVSAGGMDLFNLGNALPRIIRPLGCTIILSGIGVLLIGIYRYFSVQNALQKGLFPTARRLVVVTSAVLIAFIAINFGLFLTIPD